MRIRRDKADPELETLRQLASSLSLALQTAQSTAASEAAAARAELAGLHAELASLRTEAAEREERIARCGMTLVSDAHREIGMLQAQVVLMQQPDALVQLAAQAAQAGLADLLAEQQEGQV